MSNIDKRALREAAEKATKGEWWSDVVETEGEYGDGEDRVSGYHSYAVYVGQESLLDMTNSTAACIHTEWDHDYHMAWDETAKCNAEFIAAANPTTVLALLDELEAAKQDAAKWFKAFEKAVSVGARYEERIEELTGKLEAAEKRIAELEAREINLPPYSFFDFKQGSPFKSGAYCHIDSVNKELAKHGIKMTAAAGKGEAS
ncbi:ead/Ea22-like family protein [Enterobacter roggenkampii]|uniref:ead/Ea22-like family protein n=1 Tax=Enterobacter roggenkampii TaxID=1812935 RepID=UPI000A0EDC58|nr:ead/Ea22-like family protein [Enterobacter roggenkampii]ELW9296954.1 ead/Ea22-like family protein [Enterobacter roggenkampii]